MQIMLTWFWKHAAYNVIEFNQLSELTLLVEYAQFIGTGNYLGNCCPARY